MKGPRRIEYLERDTYRQRRYRDAARALPVFATILFFLPLFWDWEAGTGIRPSVLIVYLFGMWLALISLSALISYLIRFSDGDSRDSPTEGDDR